MYSKTVTVVNPEGMHMRPAKMLADKATNFSSEITLHTADEQEVNAKSVLGIIGLGLEKGASVTLAAEGEDEQQAVETLSEMFANGFGEL
ncbi:HPr family phosphocarrier protein [Paenibacillus xerothermodurans]|uniref:Phosphocarrier protein HPr n=1 Tax=Paenibacillus xerothermodurans TaxID=1977292 RepID=A0A2W1N936_PAEXE|nr:HPr family phosphocarrier protein [Paenibacillus xerothermodurans]PZE21149.1 HPr family phosphocarrier protein [Paenibacillus xerothermodurans]